MIVQPFIPRKLEALNSHEINLACSSKIKETYKKSINFQESLTEIKLNDENCPYLTSNNIENLNINFITDSTTFTCQLESLNINLLPCTKTHQI